MDVRELNQRRRAAVRLRQQGRVLTDISSATGLSAPTIIAACRAYAAGGWEAVDVARRGRPLGTGRLLDAGEEDAILDAMLTTSPADHGIDGEVWQAAALRTYLASRLGRAPSDRTVDRYLQRWAWPDPRPWAADVDASAISPPAEAAGNAGPVEPPDELLQHARAQGGDVYWLGTNVVRGRTLMVARNRRGAPHWLGAPAGVPAAWADFAARLQRTVAHKVWLVLPNGMAASHPGNTHRIEWVQAQAANDQPAAAAPTDAQITAAPDGVSRPTAARPVRPGIEGALTHLDRLEAESIHIMREVVAETENPVMLYSIGKDSSVMLHLALKAFYPGPLPFPLLHVDTRWKFRDMYRFRDSRVKELGLRLITHINPEGVQQDINPFVHGSAVHTDVMKTQGLKQALDQHGFDAAFGGARRDEEKSRAKERIFSFRAPGHRWDPKNQRPELWRLYNARKRPGETLRIFPLSNWTELDIWLYIHRENIPIVPLYFAAPRPVVERDGMLFMVDDARMPLREGEQPQQRQVRFRTLGCYPLTAAIESRATTLTDIIEEMLVATTSERQGRVIDFDGAGSMEKKKQEGYF